jgi:hypothetical protein
MSIEANDVVVAGYMIKGSPETNRLKQHCREVLEKT